jgi:peptidoglycan/xylan/chitin deacetylase (PgdA/CDA1 family)
MNPLYSLLTLFPRRLILLYHSLWDPSTVSAEATNPARSLGAHTFDQQLRWLNSFADFVSLEELLRQPDSRRWKVAITFDDGYRNNLEVGLPILKKYQAPMTWFVSTHFVLNPKTLPWWDLLDRAAMRLDGSLSMSEVGGGPVTLGTEEARGQLYERTQHLFFRHAPGAESLRDRLETRLANAGCSLDNGIVSKAELKEAAQSPWVTIGGHTVHHVNMSTVPAETLADEVQTGRRQLQDWTGQPVNWFAYPYGGSAHRAPGAEEIVRQAGFDGAVTTERGYVADAPDRYTLPRFTPPINGNTIAFKAGVAGMHTFGRLHQMKRRLVG